VKVVLVFPLTQPLQTVVVQKNLPGMGIVVAMLHDAPAAAGALLEGIRSAAVVTLLDSRIPATISTSLV